MKITLGAAAVAGLVLTSPSTASASAVAPATATIAASPSGYLYFDTQYGGTIDAANAKNQGTNVCHNLAGTTSDQTYEEQNLSNVDFAVRSAPCGVSGATYTIVAGAVGNYAHPYSYFEK